MTVQKVSAMLPTLTFVPLCPFYAFHILNSNAIALEKWASFMVKYLPKHKAVLIRVILFMALCTQWM